MSIINQIKEKIQLKNLVQQFVELKDNKGLCPFHTDSLPSFYVYDESQTFYCFGCKEHGDIIDFYSKITHSTTQETIIALGKIAGIDVTKSYTNKAHISLFSANEIALKYYKKTLTINKEIQIYLYKRNMNPEMLEKFQIGYADKDYGYLKKYLQKHNIFELSEKNGLLKKNRFLHEVEVFTQRIMFPIHDVNGKIVAFGGRSLNPDLPKYINTIDTEIYTKGKHVYGLFQSKQEIKKLGFAYLTEGYFDVISMHQHGYTNTIAMLGTSLTQAQVELIAKYTSHIIVCLDGDTAGQNATIKVCEMLMSKGIKCDVLPLPPKEDIDSLLFSHGSNYIASSKENLIDGLQFCCSKKQHLSIKDQAFWVKDFLSTIQPEFVPFYAEKIKTILGIDGKLAQITQKESQCYRSNSYNPLLAFVARHPDKIDFAIEVCLDLFLDSHSHNLFQKIKNREPLSEVETAYIFQQQNKAPITPENTKKECILVLTKCHEKLLENQKRAVQAALPYASEDTKKSLLKSIEETSSTLQKNYEKLIKELEAYCFTESPTH